MNEVGLRMGEVNVHPSKSENIDGEYMAQTIMRPKGELKIP